jgi:hypothetical protein
MIHQVQAELQNVRNNMFDNNNLKSAIQHANLATELLGQNDPLINLTWTNQISERNPRVASELISALDGLKDTIKSNGSSSRTSGIPNIESNITRIGDLLGEAVAARISKDTLNNPKTQAIVIANLGNEIYNSYGKAFGMISAKTRNMTMMVMGNTSGGNNNDDNASSTMSNNMQNMMMTDTVISNIHNNIIDLTAYQTTQGLASQALEMFNKNLKPITPSNATAANSKIEEDLTQIKSTIDDKGPFMDIAKLVHIQLHPSLITTYGLRLK